MPKAMVCLSVENKAEKRRLGLCLPHCKVQNSSSVTVSQINILPFKLERLLFPIDLPFCEQTYITFIPRPSLGSPESRETAKALGYYFQEIHL